MPEHGKVSSYTRGGCRCGQCLRAALHRQERYRSQVARNGRAMVPIGPVREHIELLHTSGWTYQAIAEEVGIERMNFRKLRKMSKYVYRATAARILALAPLAPVEVDEVVVERLATGGGDWRTLRATRAERLAAYEAARRAGESGQSARRRLGLAGRDTAVREAS